MKVAKLKKEARVLHHEPLKTLPKTLFSLSQSPAGEAIIKEWLKEMQTSR